VAAEPHDRKVAKGVVRQTVDLTIAFVAKRAPDAGPTGASLVAEAIVRPTPAEGRKESSRLTTFGEGANVDGSLAIGSPIS